jgi:hypothetical protein
MCNAFHLAYTALELKSIAGSKALNILSIGRYFPPKEFSIYQVLPLLHRWAIIGE